MEFNEAERYILEKIEELKLPYFSILVKKDEKEIYHYQYQKEDAGNSLLRMYSMSKPVTAVALMQLVEKGLVRLEDNIRDYLPGYDELKNIKTGEPYLEPIKIWHLLSMTSGLDYDLLRPAIRQVEKLHPDASTVELCSAFAKDGLCFAPGKGYQYSLSLDVIAALVEIISHETFSSYAENHIFKPLGMTHSTFKSDYLLADQCRKEYAPDADFKGLHAVKSYYDYFVPTIHYESGGAGIITTVEDYSLFADSLANQKNEILADGLVKEMSRIRVEETPFNETVQEYSKSSKDYGYGLAVRVRKEDDISGIPAGEFGWDGATGSYCLIDRKNHISIVIGLTIQNWPRYVKDFHIALVKKIYEGIFRS